MPAAKKFLSAHGIEVTLLLSQRNATVVKGAEVREKQPSLFYTFRAQGSRLGRMQAGRQKHGLLNLLLIVIGFLSSAGSFPQAYVLESCPYHAASRACLPWASATDGQRGQVLFGYILSNIQLCALELKVVLHAKNHYFLKYFYFFHIIGITTQPLTELFLSLTSVFFSVSFNVRFWVCFHYK